MFYICLVSRNTFAKCHKQKDVDKCRIDELGLFKFGHGIFPWFDDDPIELSPTHRIHVWYIC